MDLSKIDKGCRELVQALNHIPGIRTTDSCSGHGKGSYHIFFQAESLSSLPPLLYYFNSCHCGFGRWRIIVKTDCAMSPVYFTIEGPPDPDGSTQSEYIAAIIENHLATSGNKVVSTKT